jgi:hypothetical protein
MMLGGRLATAEGAAAVAETGRRRERERGRRSEGRSKGLIMVVASG